MNNKFLVSALAVAMAGSMGYANADVSVYGQLDVSIDATDVDGGEDDVNMGANRSAIGFKGSEKISDNLTAVFKTEFQVDIDDFGQAPGTNEDDTTEGGDTDGFKGRDMYIGLQGSNWGRVLFGSISTAYKSPGSKIDPWYRTRIQSRNVGLQSSLHKGRGEEGQGRAQNTIRYDSPKFAGGLAFTGTYTLDNSKADGEDDDPYSLGVTYAGNGFYGFASYITTDTDTPATDNNEAFQVGGKYTMGGFSVRGIFEADKGLISSTGSAAGDGADIWSLGVDYVLGNNLLTLDYGMGEENDDDGKAEYTSLRLGAQHKFTKRTNVYLGYSNQDFEDLGATDGGESEIITLGMRHKF